MSVNDREEASVSTAETMTESPREQETRLAKKREDDVDRALVDAAKQGDRAAFGKLVERYQRRIYALAYGIVRRPDDAWDVAQDAFVKAYRNLARFEGTAAFYTWLYRITYNLSIDALRERARRNTVDFEEARSIDESLEREGFRLDDDPDDMATRKELKRVLHLAMNKLSDKHRAIIVLREVEGLSYEEIADVLGISKGTVMSRLFHARQNLQALLKPYVQEGDEVPLTLKLAQVG